MSCGIEKHLTSIAKNPNNTNNEANSGERTLTHS